MSEDVERAAREITSKHGETFYDEDALTADIVALVATRERALREENEEERARNQRLGERVRTLHAEVERLRTGSPEVKDFIAAMAYEAEHQRVRWGADHDAEKSPEDWLWLVAYLCTKATQAARYGDREKYLHHIITTAAACANWHARALVTR